MTSDFSKLCYNEQDLSRLVKLILTEKAILFTGAGFSSEAINISNKELPVGKALAKKIDKLTDEDSYMDLRIASENAVQDGMQDELINLLMEAFTVKTITQQHQYIIQLPWSRYYTTNYDDTIKQAGRKSGKIIKCVTTDENPSDNLRQQHLCVHINGNLETLNEDTLNTSFKLSESSYLNHDALNDTPWVDVFNRDLKYASAIVFIGYSIYDYNIKKLLFNNDGLKEKTYFITRDKLCQEIKKEKQYGKVINIGMNRFANYCQSQLLRPEFEMSTQYINDCFKTIDILDDTLDVTHDEIRDFLIYGKYDDNYIFHALLNQSNKHLILPSWIDECMNLINENNFIHIFGDLGTGKSVGAKILSYQLALNGETVFVLENKLGDYQSDIKNIISKQKKVYIFIDNADVNHNIVQYIHDLNDKKVHCISVSRKSLISLKDLDFNDETKVNQVYKLSKMDSEQLIKIINSIGALSSYSNKALERIIEDDCNSVLPAFLLKLMKSTEIETSIKREFLELDKLNGNKYQKTLILLCLLGTLNRDISFSTISELTQSSNIRNCELLSNYIFKNFFTIENSTIECRSAVFVSHILQSYYMDNIKKDTLIDFAIIANKQKNETSHINDTSRYEYEKIFKELLKYVSLSRIFKKNEYQVILNYFEKLQIELSWLQNEPNFWIQLALLNMARNKLDIAIENIKTANDKASKKEKYQMDYIYTVEAGLKIKIAMQRKTKNLDAYTLFLEADDLLKKVEASDQKYKNMYKYKDIFIKVYQSLPKSEKENFLRCTNNQLKRIGELAYDNYFGIDRVHVVYNCESNLNEILNLANA